MARKPRTPPLYLSMDALRWSFITDYGSNVGMPGTPTQVDQQSWDFDMPSKDERTDAKVGYLLCRDNQPILKQTLRASFRVTASPGTVFVDQKEPFSAGSPCTFRPIIMRTIGEISDINSRIWWHAGTSLDIVANQPEFVLDFDLTNPALWILANGANPTAAQLSSLLSDHQNIGLTFGAVDAGHGIAVSGGECTFLCRNMSFV